MAHLLVLTPLRRNGACYQAGAIVDLPEKEAIALVRVGVLSTLVSKEDGYSQAGVSIQEVMVALDSEDKTLWTHHKKPKASVLSSRMQRPVTAKERDEAWSILQGEGE